MRRLLPTLFAAALLLVALPAFAGNGSNLLPFVPGSAQVVVGVDVDKVRGTPVWTQLMRIAGDNSDLQNTLNTLRTDGGFDPFETIHSIVVASNVVSDSAGDHAVVLIEVDYPAEQFANVLIADEYTASTVGEIRYFRKSESTIAFLGSNIVAVGEFALVEPGLNAAAGQGSAGATGTVATQLGAVDRSGAIWIAVDLPSGSQGAQAGRVSIDLSSGLSANINVTMDSAEVASEAATALNAQLAGLAGAPEVAAFGLTSVLTGLQASANESDIALRVSIDAETFATLTGTLGEMAQEELR